LEEFIMELLDLASCCIHLSDRIVDFVFRSTLPDFANTASVAALLSSQAFDNASISSGVIGGFGMRRAYQRERFRDAAVRDADDRADYSIVDCVAGRGDWRLAFESTRQLRV
jgi:hypothetical protein